MSHFDESNGAFYDEEYFKSIESRYESGAHGSRIRHILECIGDISDKNILDLGCGSGFMAKTLSILGANVTGIDYAPDSIAMAKQKYPGVEFVVGSAYELDKIFAPESFACVLLLDVIEHMSDHEALMRGIRHVLTTGGHLVISTDNEQFLWARQPWARYYYGLQRFSREGRAYRALKAREATVAGRPNYHASHIHNCSIEDLEQLLAKHRFQIVRHTTYPIVGVPLRDALLALGPWRQRGDHQCVVSAKMPN